RGLAGDFRVAQHGVGADLPQNEVGTGRDHVAVEPRQHLGRVLAVDAAVEHLDGGVGEALLEQRLKPRRVGGGGGTGARPVGRGGADRDDRQRLALLKPRGGALEPLAGRNGGGGDSTLWLAGRAGPFGRGRKRDREREKERRG